MKITRQPAVRRLATLACAALVSACGGGGGGGATPATPATTTAADSRNGDYAMYAADARQYTLNLNFDAGTYRVTGNGLDLAGTLRARTTSGDFDLDNSSGATAAAGSPRFSWFSDTAVGSFRLPSGTVPFIAARSFVTSVAQAAGTYNFLASIQDTAATANSAIYTGELLAGGTLRTCNDSTIYKISLCPATSVLTATVTVAGDQFVADTGTGTYPFRVVNIGSEHVILRASASTGTSRRFLVGIPEVAAVADGTFQGANTNGQWTTTTVARPNFSATWTAASATVNRTGSASSASGSTSISPNGLFAIGTTDAGSFFALRNNALFVMISARGSTSFPGYVEIGKL
ncbi:MAG: hypothetical protein ACXWC2_05370 [Ramlibacter sp.]